MADWYGSARSNYFRVNNPDEFRAAMRELDISVWTHTNGRGDSLIDDRVAIHPEHDDKGGWPTYLHDQSSDTDLEVDLPQILSRHLADGEVAILLECGAEKLRFITGWALAVNNQGQTRRVGLDDIYALARDLGEHVTEATY